MPDGNPEGERHVSDSKSASKVKRQIGWILAALIVLAFGAIILAKQGSNATAEPPATSTATPITTQPSAPSGGPAESHADASAAYDKALASGKPIYVLFHSLTCVPCVEISAVVDKVVPAYEGRVVFVNAISDDDGTQPLLAKFPFQYIPTSFFIDSQGKVVESYTGVIDEASMKARLDKLAAQ